MGLFSGRKKEVTMRIYRTNQQANMSELEPSDDQILGDGEVAREPAVTVEEGLFERCPSCRDVIVSEDLEANFNVCTNCGHHFRLPARKRIEYTADEGTFKEFNKKLVGGDPLAFPEYGLKVEKMRALTGEKEAIVTGECRIDGEKCVLAVMDGFFMMGSMGAAVGEKFTRAAERALKKKLPLIAFTVSGGARMQEGLVSLMQMSKTSAVLGKLDDAGIPYFSVFTDPTTGGVTASFASLGDVVLTEPNALIGFAGRRVIEQTVKQSLPQTFQRAEFLMEKGFIDMIVKREDMKGTLANLIRLHKGGAK
ncbi:MAG: acetyl-CoA carboxylase, carboxyltransferase subunit beta [Christensenellaceae bacterium]|jgi:acetyl-CoA carboxylase carboxyl transferase subunit beta